MTDFAFAPETLQQPEPNGTRPPLRPARLYRYSAALVIGAHIVFFAAFMHWTEPQLISLSSIDAELVRDGDFLDSGGPAPEAFPDEDVAEQPDANDVTDLPPPPPIMEPVEIPEPSPARKQPAAKKEAEKPKGQQRKVAAANSGASNGTGRGTGGPGKGAGSGRGPGVPGGRGVGAGASEATCLAGVAASIRSHIPGATSLGPGSAFVTFHVNSGGGVSGASATGTTPAHAALARRIVASSRGPSLCAAAFASQNISFE